MAVPTEVDASAPVLVRHAVDIAAPLDTIWALHVDVDAWPGWQTDITEAHLDGGFEPGASFRWTSFDFPVVSTVYEVADRRRVLWGGTAGGITGVHEWLFEPAEGGVRVTTAESFAGAPVEADRAGMRSNLDLSLTSWLGQLKATAERTAGSAARDPADDPTSSR